MNTCIFGSFPLALILPFFLSIIYNTLGQESIVCQENSIWINYQEIVNMLKGKFLMYQKSLRLFEFLRQKTETRRFSIWNFRSKSRFLVRKFKLHVVSFLMNNIYCTKIRQLS